MAPTFNWSAGDTRENNPPAPMAGKRKAPPARAELCCKKVRRFLFIWKQHCYALVQYTIFRQISGPTLIAIFIV
jgi:hypothetical protein